MANGTQLDVQLLLEVLQCGNMDSDTLEAIEKMKRLKISEAHSYVVTPPKSEKGRWMTYIKEPDGSRRKVTATTEKRLYDKLYNLHFGPKSYTLKQIFNEWYDYRLSINISDRTVERNRYHWEKYYSNDELVTIPMKNLKLGYMEDYFHRMIREHDMTLKELNNMKFVLTDMMKFARRRDYISKNICSELDIRTNGCKPSGKKKASERILMPDEKEKFQQTLVLMMEEEPYDIVLHSIPLLFSFALRIGEFVALRECDIDEKAREIHIHRMETTKLSEGKLRPVIVDHTKKKSETGDRFLPIDEYDLQIFQKLRKIRMMKSYLQENYILCSTNGRATISMVDKKLRKVCKRAGISAKSVHDIRRTVATELYEQGVSIREIMEFMGHSSEEVTWGYIYSSKTRTEKAKRIKNSLSEMRVLKGTQPEKTQKNAQSLAI